MKIYKVLIFLTLVLVTGSIYAQTLSYPSPETYTVGIAISPVLSPTATPTPVVNGQTTTLAGSGSVSSIDGVGMAASFDQPLGAAVDASGNIYIADAGSHVIRKITPNGTVATFAGTIGSYGSVNGQGKGASFYHPVGLAVDASGNVYVADENNNMIRKITPGGLVSTLAGNGTAGFADGTSGAEFNLPCGVAVDASGNVYVADYNNSAIRKITALGTVSTIAGNGVVGTTNGTGSNTLAMFNHPFSVTIDGSGNLYVADRLNNMIRKIVLSTNLVSTLAGQTTAGFLNGSGTGVKFSAPTAITVDGSGNVYVADEGNNMIRLVNSGGGVSTLSGTGTAGSTNGIGVSGTATFYYPFAVAVDVSGNLYVGDYMNSLVRKVMTTPYSISPQPPSGLSFANATGIINGTPAAASPTTVYTVNAYYSTGLVSSSLNLTVTPSGAINANSNQNFILTYAPRVAGITTNTAVLAASNDPTQIQSSIAYLDGLGRPMQTVEVKGSPAKNDLVQPIVYDKYGRESTKYLPYAVLSTTPSDGSYKTNALTLNAGQAAFYNPTNSASLTQQTNGIVNTSYPAAVSNFELSPLNRVIEQGAPGTSWQLSTSGVTGSGHTVRITYGTNVAGEVLLWMISSNGTGATSSSTGYLAGSLYKTTTTDENGNNTIEYKDLEDHVVCKMAQNGSTNLYTYYVYDDLYNLQYVIPPIPSAPNSPAPAYPSSFAETDAVFLNYIYGYHYDSRNRLIQKKIPGKGWEFMVYNALDQPVLTQDAIQATSNQWTVTKYDALGRVIVTGLWNAGSTIAQSTLQTSIYAAAQWDVRDITNTIATNPTGYVISSYPALSKVLTINYYDDYTAPGIPASFVAPSGYSTKTKGLLTGTKTTVLNTLINTTPDMLWSVNYYDDLGRNIQTYKQHYLGGTLNAANYDAVNRTYSFTNQVTTTTRQHYNLLNGTYPPVTIFNSYIYDHMGRKLKSWEQITNTSSTGAISTGTRTLLSESFYNEVGQLMTKYLHNTTDSTSLTAFKQSISYAYNERGWLSTINNTNTAKGNIVTMGNTVLFAEQIDYDRPQFSATAQYNGNIADVYYANYEPSPSPATTNTAHTTYIYDPLNRLLGSTASTANSETPISYDAMGNLVALTRIGAKAAVLGYQYVDINNNSTGNRLQKVTNNGNTSSYTYDNNGNAVVEGSYAFTYNLLNLPQTVTATGVNIAYTYDADGDKLRKVSTVGTTDYISGIQYKTNSTVIDFIQTEEGRAINTGTGWNYEYTLTDHLGNNRATFDMINGKTGEDDYYSFGLDIQGPVVTNPKNLYTYNKKELQQEFGQYDYGARFYDPVIARWTSMDPSSEKYEQYSTYVYTLNNPLRFSDKDGRDIIVTGPEAEAFKNKLNSESKFQFKLVDNHLKPVDPNAETDPFSSQILDAINSPKTIIYNTTGQDDKDFIDQLNYGTVDEGDLDALSGNAYKLSVLQFTAERMSIDDYQTYLTDFAKNVASEFDKDGHLSAKGNAAYKKDFKPTRDNAVQAGHKAVADFLKSLFPDENIQWKSEGYDNNGQVQTDKNGNKTISYTMNYGDVSITYIDGVDENGKDNNKIVSTTITNNN